MANAGDSTSGDNAGHHRLPRVAALRTPCRSISRRDRVAGTRPLRHG
jgi:hypothetical protein